MMLSSALMLSHLKEPQAAARLQQAVEKVYAGGKHTTPDVGGKASDDRVHRRRDRGHVVKRVGLNRYRPPWTISSTKNVRPGCCMLSTAGLSAIGSE